MKKLLTISLVGLTVALGSFCANAEGETKLSIKETGEVLNTKPDAIVVQGQCTVHHVALSPNAKDHMFSLDEIKSNIGFLRRIGLTNISLSMTVNLGKMLSADQQKFLNDTIQATFLPSHLTITGGGMITLSVNINIKDNTILETLNGFMNIKMPDGRGGTESIGSNFNISDMESLAKRVQVNDLKNTK